MTLPVKEPKPSQTRLFIARDGASVNTYLDELIRSVEAEATEEEEAYLRQLRSSNHRSQHARRNLNRILQRLRTLKALCKN
jgi:hypothetical protein